MISLAVGVGIYLLALQPANVCRTSRDATKEGQTALIQPSLGAEESSGEKEERKCEEHGRARTSGLRESTRLTNLPGIREQSETVQKQPNPPSTMEINKHLNKGLGAQDNDSSDDWDDLPTT